MNLVCPCGVTFESGVPRRKFCDDCRETPKIRNRHAARIAVCQRLGMFVFL